jgi:hypothetical protein
VSLERPPIVVLGANHAGTRLVVDILTALGSQPGRVGNEWREDETFLDLHRWLIGRVGGRDWTETIFDLRFIRRFRDDRHLVPAIRQRLAATLDASFPDRTRPWHWKCPTAVLFLPSWLAIYPDACFVHIERRPEDVALSLVRRRQFLRFERALAFYDEMNGRVLAAAPAMRRYLRLSYETLAADLPRLADAAGLAADAAARDEAARLIGCPDPLAPPRRSLAGGFWQALTRARAARRTGR